MKRWIPYVVVGLVVALVIAAVAIAWTSDGPKAFSVRGQSVSQQSVNDQLEALAENKTLASAVKAQGGTALSASPGSVTTTNGAGWVGLLIAQTVAAQTVERKGLKTTADDKTRGKQLAVQSVGGQKIYDTFPGWFQDGLVERWTKVAVLENAVVNNPDQSLEAAVAKQCPSGRYVSHILVGTLVEANAIKQALDRGGDFATIAKTNSKDASAKDGGKLGCIDGQNFVEPFATVAKTQPIGVVSDPVQTQFGYHLILVGNQPSKSDVQAVALDDVLGRTVGAKVSVDPRYGIWQRKRGRLLPPASSSAPTPATTPTS